MSTEVPAGWAVRSFGDYCTQFKRLNGERPEVEPLSVTKSDGIVLQSTKFKKRIATNTSVYKVLRKGEFAYDPMSLYYGSIGRLQCIDEGVVSPAYITFDVAESVDRDWFEQLIDSELALRCYKAKTEGGNLDGKRKKTDWGAFSSIELPTPPLAEQRKIAAILGAVDDAIQATEAVIAQTRTVKAGLLQDLLTTGIGPDGRPHTAFQDTELGRLPVGWTVRRVRDIGDVQLGRQRSPKFTGTVRQYLRVANVFDGWIDTADVKSMPFSDEEYELYRLKSGDILLNEGQSLNLVGRCALFNDEVPHCCFQNTLVRFRARASQCGGFWLSVFQHFQKSGVFAKIATQTTSIAHLGAGRFAELQVPVPAPDEQARIAGVVQRITGVEQLHVAKLTQLKTLKAGLLQDLLTGAKRVIP